jgi:alpha-maltose-1-phosphate synthase
VWQPDPGQEALISNGVDPSAPYVLFVGRITRQKGLNYLLDAASAIDRRAQLVLCAGAPDTPEITEETRRKVAEVTAERGQTVWIESHLDQQSLCQLLTNAAVFVCPSVYEPFGLVNLEAMACGCPVVASAVGGIPEVVVDGETGYLVPLSAADSDGSAAGPQPELASGLALRINQLLDNPELASRMGAAGRERVVTSFSWEAVARQTVELYARAMEKAGS